MQYEETSSTPGQFLLGTSGWSYPHWAKGLFYPRGLRQSDWLPYFSRHFSTVEVNMTFYRLPEPERLQRWADSTPPGFRYSVKMWRRITHEKRLRDCEGELRTFFEMLLPLQPKCGPLLLLVPPSVENDSGLLDDFFATFRSVTGAYPWRCAIEFRNPTWQTEETIEILNRHGVSLCLADMPRCVFSKPNDVPFVYVRRHGPDGKYRVAYSERQVYEDARSVRSWLANGTDVYFYYNNDLEGHALTNARMLDAHVTGRTELQRVS